MKKAALVRGAVGGIVGGVLMGLWSMIAMWLTGVGLWTPLNLIAHTVWRAAPLDSTFSVPGLVVGLIVHFAVAIVFGLVFAALMTPAAGWNTQAITSALSGLVYGVVVWLVMQYVVWSVSDAVAASAFTPWIFGVGHLIYGFCVGLAVGPVQRTVGPTQPRPEAR